MFSLFFAQVKSYAYGIAGGLLLLSYAYLGIKMAAIKHQRDDARAQVVKLNAVITGYQAAADAARGRLDVAVAKSEVSEARHAALVSDLNSNLPKTSEEALKWAIDAGHKIGATR